MRKVFYSIVLIVCMALQVSSQETPLSLDTTPMSRVEPPALNSAGAVDDKDSVKFTIMNLGTTINTPYDDYAPVIAADGSMMIFTSNRPVTKEDIAMKVQGMENIYVSYYNDMTWKWGEAQMLGKTVNQPNKNNSAIALSNDGQRMLLYRGDPDGNIYESVLNGEEWSEPLIFPKPINSKKHESSASISPDGRTIYFISNRRGGQGGGDIWLCRQGATGWEKAENLGPSVNTPQNEEAVFIHPDGKTLYFSSKGRNIIGGYDVFKSVFENDKWSTPANMGDSINTPTDELFFTLTANGKTGYYSSVRGGGVGKKDIYEINFKKKQKEPEPALVKEVVEDVINPIDTTEIEKIIDSDASGPKLTLFKGIVIDDDSFQPLGTDIEISDNDKNKVIATIKSNSVTGKFLVSLPVGKNYGLSVVKKGYLFYSVNFNIPDSAAFKEVVKNIPLQKLVAGNKITLKNIFYERGKATLLAESKAELNQLIKLLNLSTNIKIEIASHTDSDSSEEFNLTLSQKRAQSVLEYLFVFGVSKEQMVAKGYGEANPVASNATEAGKRLNRRTEIKILEQ